jgi:hypothetical protein
MPGDAWCVQPALQTEENERQLQCGKALVRRLPRICQKLLAIAPVTVIDTRRKRPGKKAGGALPGKLQGGQHIGRAGKRTGS